MADIHRIGLDEVARHFEELEDPRSTINRRHPLVSVVVIALMAVLAGASGPTAIAKWAALKEEFLLETLDLPNGIPCKDVFRRVLVLLKPTAFQSFLTSPTKVPSDNLGRIGKTRDINYNHLCLVNLGAKIVDLPINFV